MKITLTKRAGKYLDGLTDTDAARISLGLRNLGYDPPQGDIKSLSGSDSFRLRVGKYRVIFEKTDDEITVTKIAVRGQVYKRRN